VSAQLSPFKLGTTIATDAAIEALGYDGCKALIMRHMAHDWGDLGEDDMEANRVALENNSRIFSCYKEEEGKFYVITEWDRSRTTVLLADEY